MTPPTAPALDMACVECGHWRFVVTEYWPETLVDPACGTGRCTCIDLNRKARVDGTLCDCDQPCDCEERCGCDYEGDF